MSFLTDAQIALAHDLEMIKEALAAGFVLPPRAEPEPVCEMKPAPKAADPEPWTNPEPSVTVDP